MIAAGNWIDLVETLLLVLGALGVVGTIAVACSITSMRNDERSHAERLAEKHEVHESARHAAEISYQATQAAIERDDRRQDRLAAIEREQERLEALPPVPPPSRRFRRAI